jgi:citrate lyase subunit gamma (acyl carrier protein)
MKASAGTYESSDCLIQVSHNESIKITIESVVFEQFGDQIQHVLLTTLQDHHVNNVHVECFDKGALDYTVRARLETALKRGGYIE